MKISAKLLESFNKEAQNVSIKTERWPELAVEMNQLRGAAEAALQSHDFDRDPFEFAALLRSYR